MSDRFFVSEPLNLPEVTLEGPEAHHLVHVRRFQIDDHVSLFNGDGCEYTAQIVAVEKKRAHLRIVRSEQTSRELGFQVHIGSALPKGDRADFLIEKLTELGVTDITPLETTRSVVHPKPAIVEKWTRAVIEASKQCGRNVLLRVHAPCRFDQWIAGDLPKSRWLASPDDRADGGISIDRRGGVVVAVGPEGGFTPEETSLALQNGFSPLSLGSRILRTETAALAAAAMMGLLQ